MIKLNVNNLIKDTMRSMEECVIYSEMLGHMDMMRSAQINLRSFKMASAQTLSIFNCLNETDQAAVYAKILKVNLEQLEGNRVFLKDIKGLIEVGYFPEERVNDFVKKLEALNSGE